MDEERARCSQGWGRATAGGAGLRVNDHSTVHADPRTHQHCCCEETLLSAPIISARRLSIMPEAVRSDGKVVVHFRHTGSAPILKTNKFKLPADAKFSTAATMLRKHLSLPDNEPLFLYCQTAFAPPPDELLADVAECFHVDGVLVLNYATIPAWG